MASKRSMKYADGSDRRKRARIPRRPDPKDSRRATCPNSQNLSEKGPMFEYKFMDQPKEKLQFRGHDLFVTVSLSNNDFQGPNELDAGLRHLHRDKLSVVVINKEKGYYQIKFGSKDAWNLDSRGKYFYENIFVHGRYCQVYRGRNACFRVRADIVQENRLRSNRVQTDVPAIENSRRRRLPSPTAPRRLPSPTDLRRLPSSTDPRRLPSPTDPRRLLSPTEIEEGSTIQRVISERSLELYKTIDKKNEERCKKITNETKNAFTNASTKVTTLEKRVKVGEIELNACKEKFQSLSKDFESLEARIKPNIVSQVESHVESATQKLSKEQTIQLKNWFFGTFMSVVNHVEGATQKLSQEQTIKFQGIDQSFINFLNQNRSYIESHVERHDAIQKKFFEEQNVTLQGFKKKFDQFLSNAQAQKAAMRSEEAKSVKNHVEGATQKLSQEQTIKLQGIEQRFGNLLKRAESSVENVESHVKSAIQKKFFEEQNATLQGFEKMFDHFLRNAKAEEEKKWDQFLRNAQAQMAAMRSEEAKSLLEKQKLFDDKWAKVEEREKTISKAEKQIQTEISELKGLRQKIDKDRVEMEERWNQMKDWKEQMIQASKGESCAQNEIKENYGSQLEGNHESMGGRSVSDNGDDKRIVHIDLTRD